MVIGHPMSLPTPPRAVETAYGRILIYPDEIIALHLNDDLPITLTVAQQMVTDVQAQSPSDAIHLLLLQGANSDLTFEAQRYFASVTGFARVAFVMRSRLQVEVGQFLARFLQALKTSYEFKPFYDVDAAMAWLQSP